MISTTLNSEALTTPEALAQCNFLIIGYGDESRGDAAVGPQVAMTVADWQIPSVKSLAVDQLTPELAAHMARANYVMFVDAYRKRCAQTIQIEPMMLAHPDGQTVATDDPAPGNTPLALLNLTQKIYGCHPQAWQIEISAECFDWGSQLSITARQGCDRALRAIEQFFTTYLQPSCSHHHT